MSADYTHNHMHGMHIQIIEVWSFGFEMQYGQFHRAIHDI